MKHLLIILILFCSLQGFGQTTGAKGYWRLDGNSNDASGNGNNGTNTSITFSQANGRLNQGAGFNGSTSKIILAYNSTINYAVDQIINTWVYFPYQSNRPASVIYQKGTDYNSPTVATGRGIQVSYTTNLNGYIKVSAFAAVSNGVATYDYAAEDDNFSILPNSWTMITVIYSKTNAKVRLYINSILIKETTIVNNYNLRLPVSNGYSGIIGSYISVSGTLGYFGYVNIDGLKFDNTIWSPAQIKNEYIRMLGAFSN